MRFASLGSGSRGNSLVVDAGDTKLLRQYERERKAGLAPMGLAMDGLQQLFARPEVPVQMLRNWGMKGFERSGLLKSWMAKQAMGLL